MNELPQLRKLEPAEVGCHGETGIRGAPQGAGVHIPVAVEQLPKARTCASRCGSCARGMAGEAVRTRAEVIRGRSEESWGVMG